MTINLGGIEVLVGPPAIPTFKVEPPSTSGGVLVPVAGAPGPPGQTGPAGPAGAEGPAGPPGASGGEVAIDAHVNDPTPHPVYDEGPSLLLLYENSKV